ncbi:MAG: hypothetical protein B7C24_09285 [Bacteroidetes bacterium 4572_77]|nr:MAG: hypothetical protein B7C24_09285 [Bacteroidetes bacterium 4572_77]
MPQHLQASAQFTDSDYLSDNNEMYRLSIQLRLDGFSFAIFDPAEKKLLQIKEYKLGEKSGRSFEENWANLLSQFRNVMETEHPLFEPFRKVYVSLDHQDYILLPSALFLKEKMETAFIFTQKVDYDYELISHELLGADMVVVQAVYKALFSYIRLQFPQALIVHHLSVLQQEIQKIHKNNNMGKRAYVSVSNRTMHIIVMNKEELQYCNSFSFSAKEDFIYFILLIYNQLDMNANEDPLFLLGDIGRSSAIYKICWQYIRNISFLDQLDHINMSSNFDQLATHQYYTLIHTTLCE